MNFDNGVNGTNAFERLCLGDGTRETVEQEAILAVILRNAVFQKLDDQGIRNQSA